MSFPILKYPRTPHLEGSNLQPGDDKDRAPYKMLRGRFLVWEEKVDGANCGISFSPNAEMLLQSRGHYLTGGGREIHFDLFKSWATSLSDNLFDVLTDRYILYGEWCRSKHSIYYNALTHYFFAFDVFDRFVGRFLSTPARRGLLGTLPIHHVPVIYAGDAPKHLGDLTKLVKRSLFKTPDWRSDLRRKSEYQGLDWSRVQRETEDSDLAEGGYIKIEEGDYTTDRYKWVRSDFVQIILDNDSHWLSRPLIPNGLVANSLFECPPPIWESCGSVLTRQVFGEQVFARSGGTCVFCDQLAVDAHHILDRKLFPDGGYYLDNGAALCAHHHIEAEESRLDVAQVRAAAGSRVRILPPGFDPAFHYDKWGKRLAPIGAPS